MTDQQASLPIATNPFLDDHLISILEYPLRRIDMFEKPKPTVSFKIGDTKLGPYPIKPEQFAGLPPGTAPRVVFQLGTAQFGAEQVVTVKLEPQADDSASLHVRLHNFSPPEAFVIAFHVALYGAFILAANHASPYDIPLLMRHVPRNIDFVSITEVFRNSLIPAFFILTGAFVPDKIESAYPFR